VPWLEPEAWDEYARFAMDHALPYNHWQKFLRGGHWRHWVMLNKTLYCILSAIALVTTLLSAGGKTLPAGASPNAQEEPVTLVYGQTVDGQLDTDHPSTLYAFDAQTGDVITIAMISTGGNLDPFVVLNDPNRVPLATDDSSGGGLNARLTFVIPEAGRYIIQATNAGGVPPEGGGTFTLNLTVAVGEGTPISPPETAEAPLSDIPTAEGDSVRLVKLQPNSTVRDTLDRQVALRLYWFEAQEGAQVAITPEQLADFLPLLVLFDATFAEVGRAASGTDLRLMLSKQGIFFLAVSLPDAGSAGGGYGFTVDLSGNPATADNFIDIAYGDSVQGNIDASVPSVTYRFRGTAGNAVVITMDRAGGDLNSYLYLLDSSGQLLFEDNDSGGENGNARIAYRLPADGEYLIVATRLGQDRGTTSGSYLLGLSADAAPPEEVATPEPVLPADYQDFPLLTYGQTVQGEISSAKFMDVYVFLGSADDTITIEMDSQNIDQPEGLDPVLFLLDDARIPLIENDDIVDGVERNARIQFTLPRTGYYAVVATRFDQQAGTSEGPYTLSLTGPGAAAAETATPETAPAPITLLSPAPLAAGAPAQATFDTGARLYSFTANAGSLIDVSVTTDPGLDSVLILADQNLNEILSSGTGALTGITLPKTGQYLIVLAPRFGPADQTGGGYILALTQSGSSESAAGAEPAQGSQRLSYGQTVSGEITDQAVSQIYTFEGKAGDKVRITMKAAQGSTLDCYLELRDADGTVVDANDDIQPGVVRDSQITAELPADGTYTLIASRYVGTDAEPTIGAYSLTLEQVEATSAQGVTSSTTPIGYGQTEVAEISDDQYLVFYVFDGTAGDAVTIQINTLSGNLDAVLHLYQASGGSWIEIANNDDSLTGGTYDPLLSNIILPQTGKYLIAVGRYGLDSEHTYGTFSVTLTREP
jgi:hypothetical protein